LTIGDSSPAVIATIASSSSRRPSATCPRPDQQLARVLGGEREQVGVAEALADRHGFGAERDRGVVIARRHVGEDLRQQQEPALDAVALLALQQPLRAAEPAGRATHLAAQDEVHADPERAAHGPQSLAVIEVRLVRALERGRLVVVAPEHVGRRRELLEILGRQRIRGRERVEALLPGSPRVGVAAPFEVIGGRHHPLVSRHGPATGTRGASAATRSPASAAPGPTRSARPSRRPRPSSPTWWRPGIRS
jgi:hypothetical protein